MSRVTSVPAFGRSKLGQFLSPQGRANNYNKEEETVILVEQEEEIFGSIEEEDESKDEYDASPTKEELASLGYTEDKFNKLSSQLKTAIEVIIKDKRKEQPKKKIQKPVINSPKSVNVQINRKNGSSKLSRSKNSVITDIF